MHIIRHSGRSETKIRNLVVAFIINYRYPQRNNLILSLRAMFCMAKQSLADCRIVYTPRNDRFL